MPKRYGVKEKDQVVSHIINLVLTGKLRSGDRVDRNEVAHELGLSRVPIQEAVVQLEHDGILSTRYHRGAFVERFDESVVLEHHELPSGKKLVKVNPLAAWTWDQVWNYTNENKIDCLPLYDFGYRSIGCEPCTAIPALGADARSGRWGGRKLECGIHTESKRSDP